MIYVFKEKIGSIIYRAFARIAAQCALRPVLRSKSTKKIEQPKCFKIIYTDIFSKDYFFARDSAFQSFREVLIVNDIDVLCGVSG